MFFFPAPISLSPCDISRFLEKSSLFLPCTAGEKVEHYPDLSTKGVHIKVGFKSRGPWLRTTDMSPAEKG